MLRNVHVQYRLLLGKGEPGSTQLRYFHGNRFMVNNLWTIIPKHYVTKSENSSLRSYKLRCRTSARCLSTRNMDRIPNITFKPHEHILVDEDLEIKVSGLDRKHKVSVYAFLNEDNKRYESSGCFVADDNGEVNLKTSSTTCGTYKGVSSMGLFWSMVPCPDQRDGIRLMKNNVDTPLRARLSVYDGHHSLYELGKKSLHTVLCTTTIDRWYRDMTVRSVEITNGKLRGTLFIPPGKLRGTLFIPPGPGPFPSVIDIFGTTGGLTEYRAALLASRGIVTLALPYFQYKDLPKTMMELNLDYFMDAVDWLSRETGNKEIGVIGLSKGGEIALLLATYNSKVTAVVNISGCAFNSITPFKYSGGDIPAVESHNDKLVNIDGKLTMNESFEYTDEDMIPVWRGNAKVLNFQGEEDLCYPNQSIVRLKEMYPTEQTDNFTIVRYPGAGHVIDPPYSPLCHMSYHKVFGTYFLYGGQPEEHAFAQEDMWTKTRHFFHKELRSDD